MIATNPFTPTSRLAAALLAMLLVSAAATAAAPQNAQRFGPYEIHYTVVNSTFLEPEVAKRYQLRRGKRYALLNLSVREHRDADDLLGSARTMVLKGETRDLMKPETLRFIEVIEGDAIYYLAETRFINEEHRRFDIHFRPEGASETYRLQFRHQFYRN